MTTKIRNRQIEVTTDLDVSDQKIVNVADPASAQDAATKAYVDSQVAGSGTAVTRETPTGTVNGSNTVFTLAHTPAAGSESVYLNGVLQNEGAGNDYEIAADEITFATAPATGDVILVSYRY